MNVTMPPQAIIFYDGDCGLCNRWVRWLHAHDQQGKFRFAPLQGETARRYLHESTDANHQNESAHAASQSVIYLTSTGKCYTHSDAVLQIAHDLGGGWKILSWLRIFPRFLRDAAYREVARRRRNWTAGMPNCPLPNSENDIFLP